MGSTNGKKIKPFTKSIATEKGCRSRRVTQYLAHIIKLMWLIAFYGSFSAFIDGHNTFLLHFRMNDPSVLICLTSPKFSSFNRDVCSAAIRFWRHISHIKNHCRHSVLCRLKSRQQQSKRKKIITLVYLRYISERCKCILKLLCFYFRT